MDLKELKLLVSGGESEAVEFKKSTAQLRRAAETLCGMLNGSGVWVRFLPSGYIAPHRVAHDLTDRQREILHVLARSKHFAFREIRQSIDNPPPERTLREDLIHLKKVGLIESEGFGRGAVWRLKKQNE